MSNTDTDPNYEALEPPEDKPPEEYTWAERRAELCDMLDHAGHYRNLQHSTRTLGDRYGVSHTTIQNDIHKLNEWRAEHCGQNVQHEIETLKNSAVQYYLENDEPHKAYYLMKNHYETMMEAGKQDRAADKHEIEHGGEMAWRQFIEAGEEAAEMIVSAEEDQE